MNTELPPRPEMKLSYDDIFKTPDAENRRTKIVATIGPSCSDPTILVKLKDQGMDIARLDLAAADIAAHETNLANLEKALKVRKANSVAVMVDLVGPAIKTGLLQDPIPVSISAG